MPRPAIGLLITTVIWVGVACGLWAYHDHQLKNGREIALKTVPIDPRDLLRGDYVILRYEVSTFEKADEEMPWYFSANQVVYAKIEETAGEWQVVAVGHEPPATGLYLRGRAKSVFPDRLEIAYGIESFFVPEGTGREYESARNRERLWARVSVSPHGVAYLKELEIR